MNPLVLIQLSFAGSRHKERVGMLIPTVILPSFYSVKLVGMALEFQRYPDANFPRWLIVLGPDEILLC